MNSVQEMNNIIAGVWRELLSRHVDIKTFGIKILLNAESQDAITIEYEARAPKKGPPYRSPEETFYGKDPLWVELNPERAARQTAKELRATDSNVELSFDEDDRRSLNKPFPQDKARLKTDFFMERVAKALNKRPLPTDFDMHPDDRKSTRKAFTVPLTSANMQKLIDGLNIAQRLYEGLDSKSSIVHTGGPAK